VCMLLTALVRAPRLPAQPWALTDAISYVALHANETSLLGPPTRAIRKRSRLAEQVARDATRHLVATGRLVPAGSGWYAGYEVPAPVRDSAARLFDSLPADDQRVLEDAAQRLVAMTTIWSKKSRADGSARSVTS